MDEPASSGRPAPSWQADGWPRVKPGSEGTHTPQGNVQGSSLSGQSCAWDVERLLGIHGHCQHPPPGAGPMLQYLRVQKNGKLGVLTAGASGRKKQKSSWEERSTPGLKEFQVADPSTSSEHSTRGRGLRDTHICRDVRC